MIKYLCSRNQSKRGQEMSLLGIIIVVVGVGVFVGFGNVLRAGKIAKYAVQSELDDAEYRVVSAYERRRAKQAKQTKKN